MQYENELKTITSISLHSHCKQTLSVLYWRVQPTLLYVTKTSHDPVSLTWCESQWRTLRDTKPSFGKMSEKKTHWYRSYVNS
jgi:hypothetical protein